MAAVFGVRHLSPACSLHLSAFLDQLQPQVVLIEGPSDCSDFIEAVVSAELTPPFAITRPKFLLYARFFQPYLS